MHWNPEVQIRLSSSFILNFTCQGNAVNTILFAVMLCIYVHAATEEIAACCIVALCSLVECGQHVQGTFCACHLDSRRRQQVLTSLIRVHNVTAQKAVTSVVHYSSMTSVICLYICKSIPKACLNFKMVYFSHLKCEMNVKDKTYLNMKFTSKGWKRRFKISTHCPFLVVCF
jgi:hypothetical protein